MRFVFFNICVHVSVSRSLRSAADQPPCCSCLQCLQWFMSTFLQFALVSSTLCSSASSCALEVRDFVAFNKKWYYLSCTASDDCGIMSGSRKPSQVKSVCQFFIIFSLCPLTVMFNFILHDKRKGPIWNIIMWTSLFLGQGVIICLYSQEWYAQRYCPLKEVLLIKITWCIFFPKMQWNSVIQSESRHKFSF